MSFGFSIGDAIQLTQLAWKTVQNAQKACGEHDEITKEVLGLHVVIRRLEQEVRKPTCPVNKDHDTYGEELEVLVQGCKKNLSVLDQVLTKYNALSEEERSGKRLWQKIRFGNGKISDMAELRARLTYYTSAMSLFLNMVSLGTMGRVERQLNDAGGDLKEIKASVNEIAAELMSKSKREEGSVLTAYTNDDRAIWKEFRRELIQDGFTSSIIRQHKELIKSYIEELGSRGLLDDVDPDNAAEEQDLNDIPVVESVLSLDSDTQKKPVPSTTLPGEDKLTINSKIPLEIGPEPETAKSRNEKSHSESQADSLSLFSDDELFKNFTTDLQDMTNVYRSAQFVVIRNDDLFQLFKSALNYAAEPESLQSMIDEITISTVESIRISAANMLASPTIVSRDEFFKLFKSHSRNEGTLRDQKSLNGDTVSNVKAQRKSTVYSPLVTLPIPNYGRYILFMDVLKFAVRQGILLSEISDHTIIFPSQVVLDQMIEMIITRLALRYIDEWIRIRLRDDGGRWRDDTRTHYWFLSSGRRSWASAKIF